jgi:acyl-CoA synthetase (AMP-forming)/AMP-acid ligase II
LVWSIDMDIPNSTEWVDSTAAVKSPGPWMQAVLSEMDRAPTAVRTFDGEWSGSELLARAGGAGQFLRQLVAPTTVVPALLSTTSSSIALTLGGALTDRPLAPLGTRLSVQELTLLVRGLEADVLLCDEANRDLAALVAAAAGVATAVATELPAVDPDFTATSPGSVVLVLHTSGTTGHPKAVRVRDAAVYHRARAYQAAMGLSGGDLYCSTGGFHHTGGVGMLFVAAACGAGLVPFPRFSVDAWKALAQLRPTCALLVPTMIDLLLEEKALADVALRGLHYGTAPIHPDTLRAALRALPGTEFTQAYGMTEGGPISMLGHADHLRAAAGEFHLLTSVGQLVPSIEARFDDVAGDGVGELVARGGQIFQPGPDGWLHTGDLGRTDEEGFLYLQGRKGDKIIRGGENVFPLEVERVLELHDQVREAAVIGIASRRWGQTLKAVIVAKDLDDPPDVSVLVEHARDHVARFKVPEDWEFTTELPRNAAGKLLRNHLS